MSSITLNISKKSAVAITGFIIGCYLNSSVVFIISGLITTQIIWLNREQKQSSFLLDVDNLLKHYHDKNNQELIMSYRSSFISGYISGIIYQQLYMWIVLGGILSGGTIAYFYKPNELELKMRQTLSRYKYIRKLFPKQYYTDENGKPLDEINTTVNTWFYNRWYNYIRPSIDNNNKSIKN